MKMLNKLNSILAILVVTAAAISCQNSNRSATRDLDIAPQEKAKMESTGIQSQTDVKKWKEKPS